MQKCIFIAVVVVLNCATSILADAQNQMAEESATIVSKYKGVFTSPPVNVPTNKVPDGPLLGNGDVGVTISGEPELQRFWISKTDFWLPRQGNHRGSGPKLLGGIDIRTINMRGAKYHVEQEVHEPETVATFTKGKRELTMRCWLPDSEDLVFIELSIVGGAVSVEADLWAKSGFGTTTKLTTNDLHFVTRKFNTPNLKYPTEAAMALRTMGVNPKGIYIVEDAGKYMFKGAESNRFAIQPGDKVILAAAISTNHETDSHEQDVRDRVQRLTMDRIESLRQGHKQWWRDFWAKSFVEIGDPLIEKYYYGSLGLLASCSRNKEFPPSLLGNWVTTDNPAWHGDYKLNYNYEAPYWGAYSANHVELSEPYDAPAIAFMDRGRYYARTELNCRGIYYSAGLGPKGLETIVNPPHGEPPTDGIDKGYFMGQKTNAAFVAVNMIMRFYHTYDLDYARDTAYPYLIEVVNFWEDYLKFEDGRYVIRDDALWENSKSTTSNNPMSLALVRMNFQAAIDMSVELDTDANRRDKWRHVLDHLADFPTVERDGKTVFGMGANHHIWPTGIIGFHSGPEILRIARNHISATARWDNHNLFCMFYTAAARVGYDPEIILRNLRWQCEKRGYNNLHIFHGGGGVEELSGTVSCINEMLLQSYSKILRFFPTWPEDKPARFANLRAVGAFLVSSGFADGQVQYVFIDSEKGRGCTVRNPWPGTGVTLYRNGKKAETLSGAEFIFETTAGEKIALCPEGISIEQLKDRVKALRTTMMQSSM